MEPKDHFPPHARWQLGFPAVITNGNDRKSGDLCDSHGSGTIETFCPQSTHVVGVGAGRMWTALLIQESHKSLTATVRFSHGILPGRRNRGSEPARCSVRIMALETRHL